MSASCGSVAIIWMPGHSGRSAVAAAEHLDVTYCEGWDAQRQVPVGPLPVRVTRDRDAAGEQYAVLIGPAERPGLLIEVAWRHRYCAVWASGALPPGSSGNSTRRRGPAPTVSQPQDRSRSSFSPLASGVGCRWDQMPVEELWRPPRRRGHPGWSCCFARGRGRREPGGLRWWSPAGRAAWHAQWPVDHGRPCRAGARLERFTTTVSLVAPRWPGGDRLGADPAPHGWRPPTCPPGAGGSWAVAPRPGEDHKRLATGVLRLGSMRMAAFLDAAVLTAMVGLLTDAGGRRCGAPRCGPARAAASGVIDPGLQQTSSPSSAAGRGRVSDVDRPDRGRGVACLVAGMLVVQEATVLP
jgi:hypothetical protein